MKRLIIAATRIALLASAGVADAKTTRKGHYNPGGTFIQRDVGMPSSGYHANGDFRYGPQIDYPQSPAGGGY